MAQTLAAYPTLVKRYASWRMKGTPLFEKALKYKECNSGLTGMALLIPGVLIPNRLPVDISLFRW